eukprot:GILK01003815.1.p1 GENE.GILK01003815.1~~GILK01003815.1.p1  ORF type:complete len:372 (-),score=42.27 GILK01003815.1:468-1583(-)
MAMRGYSVVVVDRGEYSYDATKVLILDDPTVEKPKSDYEKYVHREIPTTQHKQNKQTKENDVSMQQTVEDEEGQIMYIPNEYGLTPQSPVTVLFQPAEFGLTKYETMTEVYSNGLGVAVRLASNRHSGEHVALKVIDKQNLHTMVERLMVEREASLHMSLSHPHIVRLHETFEDDERLYLALEYVPGGTLQDRMKYNATVPEPTCRHMFRQLLQALDYLHERRIAHCDIKPENILIHSENKKDPAPVVKLCDFGLAHDVQHGDVHSKEAIGTTGYMAPEVLKRCPFNTAVDMWGLGIILYRMLVGFEPFYPAHNFEPTVPFPSRYFKNVSKEACDFISGLLRLDPEERLDAKQAMKHPWLNDNNNVSAPVA